MKDRKVSIDYPPFDSGLVIYTDDEPAAYIAKVMREVFERTADAGALHIAESIEKTLNEEDA